MLFLHGEKTQSHAKFPFKAHNFSNSHPLTPAIPLILLNPLKQRRQVSCDAVSSNSTGKWTPCTSGSFHQFHMKSTFPCIFRSRHHHLLEGTSSRENPPIGTKQRLVIVECSTDSTEDENGWKRKDCTRISSTDVVKRASKKMGFGEAANDGITIEKYRKIGYCTIRMSDLLAKKSGKRGGEGHGRGSESQKKVKTSYETVADKDVMDAELDDIWNILESDGDSNDSLDLNWLDMKEESAEKVVKKVVVVEKKETGSEKADEEEKKRKKAEKERQKRLEKREKDLGKAKKMLEQQETMKVRAEEARRKENEEKAREAKRKEEEDKRVELEKRKWAAERQEAERKRKEEEEKKKAEGDRKKVEEAEIKKAVEAEKKKKEDERKMAEEKDRKEAEEENRKKQEKERETIEMIEKEKKKVENEGKKEGVEHLPSSDAVLRSCRQDPKTRTVSNLILQQTIKTLESVGDVLNGSNGVTSSSTSPSTPVQFTLLNFEDTNPPSKAALVILRLLEHEGIQCQRSEMSLLGPRTKMPRAEPRRFFVNVVFTPSVARQISRIQAQKVIYEDRLVDTDLLDKVYLLPLKSYEEALNFELLRVAAESISPTLPPPIRHSLRYDGTSITHPHPYLNPQLVVITVEMVMKDKRVIDQAVQVLNRNGKNVLKNIFAGR